VKLQSALAADLTEGLGSGFIVLDHPATLDAPTGPTVSVWAASLTPAPEAPAGRFLADFTVELLTRHEAPALAEDDLATSLMAVLAVLWARGDYLLTKADRTVSEDRRLHSWTLTVTGGLTITPEA
jgi:hypothetical protein